MSERLHPDGGKISRSTSSSRSREVISDRLEFDDPIAYIAKMHKHIEALNDQLENLTKENQRLMGALGEVGSSMALSRGSNASDMLGEAMHMNLGMQAEIKRCHNIIRGLGGKV